MPDSEGLRKPRLLVIANGAVVPNAVAAEVVSNNHFAADRFSVAVALDGAAAGAAWAAADALAMTIRFSLDGGHVWRDLVHGEIDQVQLDPIRGIVRLWGRDLTARLIEARTREAFTNRTASEIAEVLAARRGLVASVQRTTAPVGRYWQLQRDRVTLDRFANATTEWDLLVALAALEGFDVWVSGATLHFRPSRASEAGPTVLRPVATLSGPANVTAIRLERTLTLARDIEVVVKSWNARQQEAFVQTARSRRRRRPVAPDDARPGEVQRYVYVVPNLTPDEALALAQRKLAELSRHERVLVAEMPGELDLAPRMRLRLEGSFTDFDQTYWVDEIERRMDVRRGFSQTVRARNASPA